MPDIASIIQSGAANAWYLLPTALVLGALHALEPGHSKSMMVAFIVAVHGTARQAALLAIAATIGHTIVVWALALVAWRLGDSGVLERAEPWLLLVGGLLLVALAVRILRRLAPVAASGHGHHDHAHDHAHADGHHHHHDHNHHSHGHRHGFDDEDVHAVAHEAEIRKRFAGAGAVTNGEIAWFGFTGGLLPCPAAFAVLLACLHQKAYGLGLVMVAAFSIGLALMLVAVGVAAAWGMTALKGRFRTLDTVARWAPYASAAVVLVIGLSAVAQGLRALDAI